MEKAGLRRAGEFTMPGFEKHPAVKYVLERDRFEAIAARV